MEYFLNLLERILLWQFFVFKVNNIISSKFWPRFWFWTQILPAQWTMGHNIWFVVAVLLLYRTKILAVMLPLTSSTVLIQLQLHYAGSFWVQNQHNSWSIPDYSEDLRLLRKKKLYPYLIFGIACWVVGVSCFIRSTLE